MRSTAGRLLRPKIRSDWRRLPRFWRHECREIQEARFPNSRLDLVAKVTRVRARKLAQFQFQGFVDGQMMFEGEMLGVIVNRDQV